MAEPSHDVPDTVAQRFVEADENLRLLAQELTETLSRGRAQAEAAASLAESGEAMTHLAASAQGLIVKLSEAQASMVDALAEAKARMDQSDVASIRADVTQMAQGLDESRASAERQEQVLAALATRLESLEGAIQEQLATSIASERQISSRLAEATLLVPSRKRNQLSS